MSRINQHRNPMQFPFPGSIILEAVSRIDNLWRASYCHFTWPAAWCFFIRFRMSLR